MERLRENWYWRAPAIPRKMFVAPEQVVPS